MTALGTGRSQFDTESNVMMEGMFVNENSNWVKARAGCSIAKVFDELRDAVKGDVDERNNARQGESIKFALHSHQNLFSVSRQSAAAYSSVEFTHDDAVIIAKGPGVTLMASLGLNDEGLCRFRVEGELLEGWQFRMKALDALFFGVSQ